LALYLPAENKQNSAMQIAVLNEGLWFPPVEEALPDGLLAVGGDLSTERLLLAYRSGIFPWFSDDEPPLWWSPDPRFVLFPPELRVSKSMKKVLSSNAFEFRVNTAFEDVIACCSAMPRRDQDGTWITDDIIAAYTELHRRGFAVSAEAWQDGKLVGGLYGIRMGNCFFGESMFSKISNASKFAFINWVRLLQQEGVAVIDCQVHTEHLESLGARMIPRASFMQLLGRHLP
jgi:leucyl/phenylalanyl-tRNA---protein transferase